MGTVFTPLRMTTVDWIDLQIVLKTFLSNVQTLLVCLTERMNKIFHYPLFLFFTYLNYWTSFFPFFFGFDEERNKLTKRNQPGQGD